MFKGYQYALPEDKGSIRFKNCHDIVKLLNLGCESKSGLSIYYIKPCLGKNIFDHMFDRIGQMNINGISYINMIGFSKSFKKEQHNHYKFLTWEYRNIASNNVVWIDFTVARLRWVVIGSTHTQKSHGLSVYLLSHFLIETFFLY